MILFKLNVLSVAECSNRGCKMIPVKYTKCILAHTRIFRVKLDVRLWLETLIFVCIQKCMAGGFEALGLLKCSKLILMIFFIALEQLWNTTQHDDNSNETLRLWLCCQLCDNSFKLHLRQITCAFQGLLDFAFVFGSVQALFSHGLHLLGFFWKKWN